MTKSSLKRCCSLAGAALLALGNAQVLAQPPEPSAGQAAGRLLRVGPGQPLRTVAAAAAQASDGDTVEIEAGDYVSDVAVWTRDGLTVRGVGGRVRLIAGGASAERKAIWVVRGGSMTVENIDFIGARVADRNGAGIRLEKGRLRVRNCLFDDNENGILTSNDKDVELDIEGSEFSGLRTAGVGVFHNLYAGLIRRLKVSGSYFHHARIGHLLKSRAAENYIVNNRLTDESGGMASYELDFPAGGLAYVVGNIVQQGSLSENPHLIAFGAEGYKWPRNELHLVNNTLVDDFPAGGVFLKVRAGAQRVRAVNNLLVGDGRLDSAAPGEYASNFNVGWEVFAMAPRQDYRLRKKVRSFGGLAAPGMVNGFSLALQREYAHPRQTRPLAGAASLPGALQSPAP